MGFKDSKTAAKCCILLALLIIPYTDAQNNWPPDVQQPANPTIVVEGVNSSKVYLVWGSPAKQGGTIVQVIIERGRPGSDQRDVVALKFGGNAFNVQAGFESDYTALLPSTLKLLNVDNTEEYDYFVSYTYQPGGVGVKVVRSQVRVIVNVPPRITNDPARNSRVNAGQNLTLTCNASGDPMPTIVWSREGATTNQLVNATGNKLTLVNVQRKDVGSYKCTAKNAYGTASSLALVNLILPPRITKEPARNSRVNAGQNLTLTCNASGDPMPTIVWSREGATTNQLVNATGYKLTLVNVQKQDVGSYKCTAKNAYGTASSLALVNLILPPRITKDPARNSRVNAGQNLTLTCNASGDPMPTIVWSREGATTNQLVNATGYKLTLVNVQKQDVGSYKCTAKNAYGTASSLALVNLILPPRITKEPARNSRVNAGQNLTLTCNASGDPMPTIVWSREGATTNQLVNATGYKLTLVNVQKQDVGSYKCTAKNAYGTASSLALVNLICSQCNTTTVVITVREGAVWRDSLRNRESLEFKMLASNLTSAIVAPYSRPENEGKQLHEVAIKEFIPGSVIAIVQMQFPRDISDPLQPLRSEMNDERLGIFTVNRELDLKPTTTPSGPMSPSANIPSTTSTTETSTSTAITGLLVVVGGVALLAIVTVI